MFCVTGPILRPGAILERREAAVGENYSVAAYEWYWLSSTSTRLGFEPS
jgi:hypothetical protein